jgi:hypothetical protein
VVTCFFRRCNARNRERWGNEDPPQHGATRAGKGAVTGGYGSLLQVKWSRKMPWMVWGSRCSQAIFSELCQLCKLILAENSHMSSNRGNYIHESISL